MILTTGSSIYIRYLTFELYFIVRQFNDLHVIYMFFHPIIVILMKILMKRLPLMFSVIFPHTKLLVLISKVLHESWYMLVHTFSLEFFISTLREVCIYTGVMWNALEKWDLGHQFEVYFSITAINTFWTFSVAKVNVKATGYTGHKLDM